MKLFWIAPLVALGLATPASGGVKDLQFVLSPGVTWLSDSVLAVSYVLRNLSQVPVIVVQTPGPALMVSCDVEGGGRLGGAPGGAWCGVGKLDEKYFLELAPGQALVAEKAVVVPKECRGNLTVLGVYQSDEGEFRGVRVTKQTIDAEPLLVEEPASRP